MGIGLLGRLDSAIHIGLCEGDSQTPPGTAGRGMGGKGRKRKRKTKTKTKKIKQSSTQPMESSNYIKLLSRRTDGRGTRRGQCNLMAVVVYPQIPQGISS